jgi:hypothetical protein
MDSHGYLSAQRASPRPEPRSVRDGHSKALSDVRAATSKVFTHELHRKNGPGLFLGGMMHPDARGPWGLLLHESLAQEFPEGYRVAIPETSCGLAISKQRDAEEQSAVNDIIAKCFGQGTRPLAPDMFEPEAISPKAYSRARS